LGQQTVTAVTIHKKQQKSSDIRNSPSTKKNTPSAMSNYLDTVEIESATNPSVAIIWMHGLGADANDFVPIVQELDLSGLPRHTLRVPERANDAGDDQQWL
jgi:hypothetical protein